MERKIEYHQAINGRLPMDSQPSSMLQALQELTQDIRSTMRANTVFLVCMSLIWFVTVGFVIWQMNQDVPLDPPSPRLVIMVSPSTHVMMWNEQQRAWVSVPALNEPIKRPHS